MINNHRPVTDASLDQPFGRPLGDLSIDTLKKEHSFLFRCIGDMLLRIPHPFTPRERIESSHSRSHRLGRTVLPLLAGVA